MRRITDTDVDAALRALVVEDEDVALQHRVLTAIRETGTIPRDVLRGTVPDRPHESASRPVRGGSWPRHAAFAGGLAVAALMAIAVLLNRDVPLPAQPAAPPVVLSESAEPLAVPDVVVSLPAPAADVRRAAYRPFTTPARPASPPLIDPLERPAPLAIERLQTPPLAHERARIPPITIEPLSVPPLDGD